MSSVDSHCVVRSQQTGVWCCRDRQWRHVSTCFTKMFVQGKNPRLTGMQYVDSDVQVCALVPLRDFGVLFFFFKCLTTH